jgi:hypothetical protein
MGAVPLGESPDVHFDRALVHPVVVLCLVGVLVAGLVAWILMVVEPAAVRASSSAAILVAVAGAVVAGNTFRLRDVQQRRAYHLRALRLGDPARAEAWSRLVPPATIRCRLLFALVGAVVGLLTFVGNLVLAAGAVDPVVSLTTCFLGVIACVLGAVAGSTLRPFD